jgi:hypothetical protein
MTPIQEAQQRAHKMLTAHYAHPEEYRVVKNGGGMYQIEHLVPKKRMSKKDRRRLKAQRMADTEKWLTGVKEYEGLQATITDGMKAMSEHLIPTDAGAMINIEEVEPRVMALEAMKKEGESHGETQER